MKLIKTAAALLVGLSTGLLTAPAAFASGGESHPYFRVDTSNLAGLQRGARDFMSYCAGCHSLKYLRYNRMASDLGIPEDQLKANLMFTSDKLGDTIGTAMPKESADWLGAQPPDLSLTARARPGVDQRLSSELLSRPHSPARREQHRATGCLDAACALGAARLAGQDRAPRARRGRRPW